MTTPATWERLHRDARHALRYPSEHVVRFLASLDCGGSAIDIGCGSGRHLPVLEEFGFDAIGCDRSRPAGLPTGYVVAAADMRQLPYSSGSFDVALAYGVFYYGTRADHRQAIAEMHRVLRPGGRAFVSIRTNRDWRNQFTYGGVFHHVDEPEDGMEMHFVTQYELPQLYGAFTSLEVDETMTTRKGRGWDSDWLLTLTK